MLQDVGVDRFSLLPFLPLLQKFSTGLKSVKACFGGWGGLTNLSKYDIMQVSGLKRGLFIKIAIKKKPYASSLNPSVWGFFTKGYCENQDYTYKVLG